MTKSFIPDQAPVTRTPGAKVSAAGSPQAVEPRVVQARPGETVFLRFLMGHRLFPGGAWQLRVEKIPELVECELTAEVPSLAGLLRQGQGPRRGIQIMVREGQEIIRLLPGLEVLCPVPLRTGEILKMALKVSVPYISRAGTEFRFRIIQNDERGRSPSEYLFIIKVT